VSGPLWITGHAGLVGSALMRAAAAGGIEIITVAQSELDLRNRDAVENFLAARRPTAIIHAAARHGGIALHLAQPAAMREDNAAIVASVIHGAAKARVPRLLYISSACVYTGNGEHPCTEASTSDVVPDGAMAGYAEAKIAGMLACETLRSRNGLCYHSIIPCNLYGPGDNYHPEHATVVPGMMRRMHEAKVQNARDFAVWGSGKQRREFLHADDLAAACLFLLTLPDPPPRANCGTGISTPLIELAEHLKAITGFAGALIADPSKPDGPPRPPLDSSLLRSLGWSPRIALEDGLRSTYAAFKNALLAGTLRE
jgi:GDP-L-fucose synthase